MNVLFITNPKDVSADVDGGVQVCSKEFLELLKACNLKIFQVHVDVSKSTSDRILRKLQIDAYRLYSPKKYLTDIYNLIDTHSIRTVFINKSELIRFSRPIKEKYGDKVKIIIFSHGNETGDFLHYITRIKSKPIQLVRNLFRLGYNLFIESDYRIKFVDNVYVLSDQEKRIEQWLGIKNPVLVYRTTQPHFIEWHPNVKYIGFVGSLDHIPNVLGLEKLINALRLRDFNEYEIRLVGGPEEAGKKFEGKFDEVNYLGRLTDEELRLESENWSVFLNPVFYFSRGASTKLAKGLNLGLPILSTEEGNRGYEFESNEYLSCENEFDMADKMIDLLTDSEKLVGLQKKIKEIATSSSGFNNIIPLIKGHLNK